MKEKKKKSKVITTKAVKKPLAKKTSEIKIAGKKINKQKLKENKKNKNFDDVKLSLIMAQKFAEKLDIPKVDEI